MASIGGLLFGYHFAVFSAVTTFRSFEDWFGSWPPSKQLLLGAYFLGVLLGCLHQKLLPWVAFRPGWAASERWRWLRLSAALSVFGALVPFVIRRDRPLDGHFEAGAFAALLCHRILCGIGTGIANVVGPAACIELAPVKRQGFYVFLYQFAITFGILSASVLVLIFGHEDVQRQVDPTAGGAGVEMRGNFLRPLRVALIPAVLMLVGLFSWDALLSSSLPSESNNIELLESGVREPPLGERHLKIESGTCESGPTCTQDAQLLSESRREFRQRDIEPRRDMMESVANRLPAKNAAALGRWNTEWRLLLRDEQARICIMLQMLQQLTGINAILIYSVRILEQIQSASLGWMRTLARLSAPLYGSVLISVVNVSATVIAMLTIDRFPRRRLYLLSTPLLAVCQLVLAWGTRTGNSSGLAALCSCLALLGFVAVFAVSHGPLAMLVTNELVAPEKRALANTASMLVNISTTFLISIGFPFMQSHIFGPAGIFVFFALVMLGAEYWLWCYLPETRRLSVASHPA